MKLPRQYHPTDLAILSELERKGAMAGELDQSIRQRSARERGRLKVGGHQASSASLATIMTALYFRSLRPQDRVAVKPHASPNFHAIQYLLGKQTREKLETLPRLQGRAVLSVAHQGCRRRRFLHRLGRLGVAQTLFSSLVQDYVRAHGWVSTGRKAA